VIRRAEVSAATDRVLLRLDLVLWARSAAAALLRLQASSST